ncbi:hypothetical protein [Glycomyces salinus]|uniref:hypothetical protein n=1 Tax=Glycomyces salinus TaxID=980294 RepID=UPI0018ECE9F8|nr:hypothetical protein [Glycomyces salinus]
MKGTTLKGIPGPILIAVAILWISAAAGLIESGADFVDHTDSGGDPFTALILMGLIFADLVNAVLGLGIQLHRRWARVTAIMVCLMRTAVALIAATVGEFSYVWAATNLAVIVLMLFPSAAAWCDR